MAPLNVLEILFIASLFTNILQKKKRGMTLLVSYYAIA